MRSHEATKASARCNVSLFMPPSYHLPPSGVWSQETVLALAPFLEEDVVERLVTAELADPPSWEGLVELAPFLPKKTVADLLERLMAPSRGA